MIKKKIKKANFLKYSKNLKSIKFKDLKKLEYFSKNNNTNSRFCFHKDVGDKHQEMIILQKKFSFFPPKKNTKSDQTFLILRGRLLILTFNKLLKVLPLFASTHNIKQLKNFIICSKTYILL